MGRLSLPSWAGIAALSFLALIRLAPAAHARTWYILDYNNGTCEAASVVSPEASTPEQYHAALREEGTADVVKVTKDAGGEVVMVAVTASEDGSPVTMMWFPAANICETVRKAEMANGSLPNMDDLK
jgi:hypothetical protein